MTGQEFADEHLAFALGLDFHQVERAVAGRHDQAVAVGLEDRPW
jgi:hypothetical protein